MKLSVLIPTHNRPVLFTRALNSVLSCCSGDVEIIINNDTHDIVEQKSQDIDIKYHYRSFDDLSQIYEFLYNEATGDYVYYLEDDDYILPSFNKGIEYDTDVYYMEYYSLPLADQHGIVDHFKLIQQRELINITDPKLFYNKHKTRYFQLGQLLFRRFEKLHFPTGDNIENDLQLFKNVAIISNSIKYITGRRWVQTIDGHDNLSFNHDI